MSALFLLTALSAYAGPDVQFSAGSYGRVQMTSDLRGGRGEDVNVASHPPRLELGPYLELDLRWDVVPEEQGAPVFEVLITPAISGDLFHFDGVFAEGIALRNLYVGVDGGPWAVWAGSRMLRGDDVYLLDFWPLDNLNTLGAGGAWRWNDQGEVALHVGANRLFGGEFQFQQVDEPLPGGVGTESVLVLDRQRVVGSARAVQHLDAGKIILRGTLYGELHLLPAGERVLEGDERVVQPLPSDQGSLVGAQLSAWGWAPQSFVHLWVRRSTGLAAVGELTIPVDGFDVERRVEGARSWMFAVSGNHDTEWFGVQAGAYLSSFVDADGQAIDFDDRWEWVGVVRPQAYVGRYFVPGVELSHQIVRPNGLNPRTGDHDVARITKLSVIPALQPDRGAFTRPRVHVVYTATFLDSAARAWFAPTDVRVREGVNHFVGVGAEWWVNADRVVTPQQTRH